MAEKNIYCRYCGKSIDEDAEFCTHCGKQQLVYSPKLTTKATRYIKACVKLISSVLWFLVNAIIMPLKWLRRINVSQEKKDKYKKTIKHTLRILIVVVIVGVLCIGLWGLYIYYYEEYLPEKYRKEAYNDMVQRYNKADNNAKLDLAIKMFENSLIGDGKSIEDEFYRRAYNYIIEMAKKGNGKAQYFYGKCFLGPYSVESVIPVRMEGLFLGKPNYNPNDTTRAVYWFNEAAKNGYPKAYSEIGTAYEKGICVSQNLIKAVELFKKGAALNDAKSQYKLGCMYRDGISVENGWHWETKSTTEYMSDKDNVIREYWDYKRNTTVYVYREKVTDYKTLIPKDINKARYWWKKAEARGYSPATECLQQM